VSLRTSVALTVQSVTCEELIGTTEHLLAGSIPDGDIGTLASTQLLTELSTRDISWKVKAAGANCIEILGASASWSPKGLSRPV
jgi:hypothetical protein